MFQFPSNIGKNILCKKNPTNYKNYKNKTTYKWLKLQQKNYYKIIPELYIYADTCRQVKSQSDLGHLVPTIYK
jgi:hypothetical protein